MIPPSASRIFTKIASRLDTGLVDSSEEDLFLRRQQLTNFTKIYFDFAYYLGSSPFRLVKDLGTGLYYIKVWRFQQVICAFLHILCLFRLISQIRESIPEASKLLKNPTPYFDIVLGFCGFFYKLATMKRFWLDSEKYLKIVNFILNEKYLPVKNKLITKSYFSYILYSISVLKITACFISGYGYVIPIGSWSPSWWLRRLVAQANYVFCFGNKLEKTKAPELEDITLGQGILAVLMAFGNLQRWAMGDFCDHCILAAAFTLWTTATSFSENIQDLLKIDEEWDQQTQNGELPQLIRFRPGNKHKSGTAQQPWSLIYWNFQAIQNLAGVINSALGSQVTWYMAEGLMYYSISLNSVLLTRDEFKRLYKIMFYGITFGILWVSSDICTKLETVKTWLVKNTNMKTVPSDEANLVLHEMITKDIGIRGSDVFTITFPMVAGFLSLIVTFFVICVQQSDFGVD